MAKCNNKDINLCEYCKKQMYLNDSKEKVCWEYNSNNTTRKLKDGGCFPFKPTLKLFNHMISNSNIEIIKYITAFILLTATFISITNMML